MWQFVCLCCYVHVSMSAPGDQSHQTPRAGVTGRFEYLQWVLKSWLNAVSPVS